MLAIKLQKVGRKHQPSFRLVVAEKRSKLISPPVEDLGSYNPSSKEFSCNRDRVLHWIEKGAQPTDTAFNLLVSNGVVPGPKRVIRTKAPAPKDPSAEAATPKTGETAVSTSEETIAEAASETASTEGEAPTEKTNESVKEEVTA